MGKVYVWRAGGKPGGTFDASCMKAAEPIFRSVVRDFKVVGYCLTVTTVTKNRLMKRLFKMEVLHCKTLPALREGLV
jgi:hypothetical protein